MILFRLFVLLLLATTFARAAEPILYRAAYDFSPPAQGDYVPFYAETKDTDPAKHGLAVNTVRHSGNPAAAEVTFSGAAGRYDLTLHAVAEEDGQSTYKIYVNGVQYGSRHNPLVEEKRVLIQHVWPNVPLKEGDVIRVVFNGASSGLIREHDNFAWARGRWRALSAFPSPD